MKSNGSVRLISIVIIIIIIIIIIKSPSMAAGLFQVFSDPEAAKYVSGIGVHWYIDEFSPLIALDYTHEEFPDMFLLATEATVKVVKIGVWGHAQAYASDILDVS